MRFLIVDDDKNIRILLGLFLSGIGECVSAASGPEAVKQFRKSLPGQPFDAVFLDISMPGLSGHEVALRLRELEKEFGTSGPFKLIMASAYDDAQNMRLCFELSGADGFLVKPFNEEDVLAELAKLGLV